MLASVTILPDSNTFDEKLVFGIFTVGILLARSRQEESP